MKIIFNNIKSNKKFTEISLDGGESSIFKETDELKENGYVFNEEKCVDLSYVNFGGGSQQI